MWALFKRFKKHWDRSPIGFFFIFFYFTEDRISTIA